MNTNRARYLSPQFEPDVEFELTPQPGTVSPDSVQVRFQELQNRLLEESLGETPNPILRRTLRRAANEAAALSWTTQYPLLIMPLLFHEKARSVRLRLAKQSRVLIRSQRIVEAVNDWDSG